MAHDIAFFLAPDDEAAAATRLRGPGDAFRSVTCRFIEPDSAIAEWDMYFEEPSAETPPLEQLYAWRPWPEYVTAPLNDGIEVFAAETADPSPGQRKPRRTRRARRPLDRAAAV